MAFMESTTNDGEDFKVYVKYNAKAGRWYTKEDKPDAEEFEVSDMTAVFDFPNLKTGWFLFAPGVAPVKQLNAAGEFTPKPGPDFKRGFQVDVFSGKNLGGVREFASTAGAVIDAMNAVHDRYEMSPEATAGKLPIVKCVAVKPIVGKHGTNYSPELQIVGWTDRPAELTEAATVVATPSLQPAAIAGFDTDLDDDVPF
jgi:hypothetical protein